MKITWVPAPWTIAFSLPEGRAATTTERTAATLRMKEIEEQLAKLKKQQKEIEGQRADAKRKDSEAGGGKEGEASATTQSGEQPNGGQAKKAKVSNLKPFPDECVEPLKTLLMANRTVGVDKIVAMFSENNKGISQRQLKMKIGELAVKERRPPDTAMQWHLRTPEETEAYKKVEAQRQAREKERVR